MKKIFLGIVTVFVCSFLFAQNIEVNINNVGGAVNDDCGERINGICSSEDIGGVDIATDKITYRFGTVPLVNFKNHNNFTVNVAYEINGEQTGSLVLKENETKEIRLKVETTYKVPSVKLVVRQSSIQQSTDSKITLMGYLHVYPEDLGEFFMYPNVAIDAINKNKAYGIGNWRLPTYDELEMLEQNKAKVNLENSIYATQIALERGKMQLDPWRKGLRVRLVATEE